MNLKNLLSKLSLNKPKDWLVIFSVLSFIGLLDAVYLTVKHYNGSSVVCSLVEGCDRVLSSSYATIGLAPLSLLGVLYYMGLFIVSIIYWQTKKGGILYIGVIMAGFGFLASLWFLYLQALVINAYCLYCLISLGISTLLFAIGLILTALNKKTKGRLIS